MDHATAAFSHHARHRRSRAVAPLLLRRLRLDAGVRQRGHRLLPDERLRARHLAHQGTRGRHAADGWRGPAPSPWRTTWRRPGTYRLCSIAWRSSVAASCARPMHRRTAACAATSPTPTIMPGKSPGTRHGPSAPRDMCGLRRPEVLSRACDPNRAVVLTSFNRLRRTAGGDRRDNAVAPPGSSGRNRRRPRPAREGQRACKDSSGSRPRPRPLAPPMRQHGHGQLEARGVGAIVRGVLRKRAIVGEARAHGARLGVGAQVLVDVGFADRVGAMAEVAIEPARYSRSRPSVRRFGEIGVRWN